MKYIEINKETGAIWAGIFESDILPVFAEDSPVEAVEVVSSPDDYFARGQVYNRETKEIEDTDESISFKSLIYLRDTDWYVIRNIETGVAVPEEVTTKRAEARSKVV